MLYEYMKLLQPVAEEIGGVSECKCEYHEEKYFDYNEVLVTGVTLFGGKYELRLKVYHDAENP